jgi:hypothetical protein
MLAASIFVPCPCIILFLLSAPLMGRAAALIPYALSLKHLTSHEETTLGSAIEDAKDRDFVGIKNFGT